MNSLDTPMLTLQGISGPATIQRTLPGTLAALVRNEVGDFSRLRPHQRHPWHAFLVQVAALACRERGDFAPSETLPDEETVWREWLLALSGGEAAAWALVSPPAQPAFLQAPEPSGHLKDFKSVIESPDGLDMLVIPKNHDLKVAAMMAGEAEHWLYALVSLQTQEGYSGAGNYGISRMNGGFASRPGLGVEPGIAPGGRFVRDLKRILAERPEMLRRGYPPHGGLGLVWLEPWDGLTTLLPQQLDPFYIEICRRVRLTVGGDGRLQACAASSKVARIEAKSLKGQTGDPWTPLVPDKDGLKALTVSAEGFAYRKLVPILFPRSAGSQSRGERAILQDVTPDDAATDLSILCRALVRGQGKTEGYHERRVPVSKVSQTFFGSGPASDKAAACAHDRVEHASLFARKVLYPAVLNAYTGAPAEGSGERKRDDDTARDRARRVCNGFDQRVDVSFFAELEKELAVLEDPDACHQVRGHWLERLKTIGREILNETIAAAPHAAVRDWRVRVRCIRIFEGSFRNTFKGWILTQETSS